MFQRKADSRITEPRLTKYKFVNVQISIFLDERLHSDMNKTDGRFIHTVRRYTYVSKLRDVKIHKHDFRRII